MSKKTNELRSSQLISTFGPGAMVDLPTRSVIIGGLELWDMKGRNTSTVISEPRLSSRLETLLKKASRLDPAAFLTLRTPPVAAVNGYEIPCGVETPVFPAWFVCDKVELVQRDGKTVRRRRLVRWNDLDTKGRRQYVLEDGKKTDVIPIRFVAACENGHLQDIDWRWAVHRAQICREPMWLEELGTSADPADTSVVCGCKSRLSLADTFMPGRLGRCRGERPWLLTPDPDGCDQNLKLLTRTATNTYFALSATVISLPAEEDDLSKLVAEVLPELTGANVQSPADVKTAKQFNLRVREMLGPYSDIEIFERFERMRKSAQDGNSRPTKDAEIDILTSGRAEIGQNQPTARLHAQTLARDAWADSEVDLDLSVIERVVAVHRLREVSAIYGFTRFEAAPGSLDGEIEDVTLSVGIAPLSRNADWLPAIEQRGEGIFIQLDAARVRQWLMKPDTQRRNGQLVAGYAKWQKRFRGKVPEYRGTGYVLLHSISHALMAEIALDCGYPATSLKERVYVKRNDDGDIERCGILIYTASAGAQGTLGGLVGTAPRIAHILRSALDRLAICSNDPVCADHEPDSQTGDRSTHGAACHGCLLIAETSCETRNLFLDRSLITPTMADDTACFFSRRSGSP